MNKEATDIMAMVCTAAAIITGFMLHDEVHHQLLSDNIALWTVHETVGIILAASISMHCTQHKPWFKNYRKIPVKRKRPTTILLAVAILVIMSGILLMCGSHSQFISIFHYIGGILFTLLATAHALKRWPLFRSLFR
ncbi:MAG: hypothetical protein K2J28_11380 [Duncaniella sp.]|nr:hypothetical protein [Bacteroides sp.]MDE6814397.1 hypothetical protein [Duncaniella sp.]